MIKKIIGFILRITSIFAFIMFLAAIINTFFFLKPIEEGTAFFIGYATSIAVGISGMGWINYQLYKYSGKLLYSKKNKE